MKTCEDCRGLFPATEDGDRCEACRLLRSMIRTSPGLAARVLVEETGDPAARAIEHAEAASKAARRVTEIAGGAAGEPGVHTAQANAAAAAAWAAIDRASPTRWEYHVEEDPDPDSDWSEIGEARFDELGADGWELVSVGWHRFRGTRPCRAVFRRPARGGAR